MWDVHVCAACLATDVKMFSMSSYSLLQPYQLLSGVQLQNNGMPRKLCWECAALVNKFNLFRDKCERAHLLLQDLYNQHDEITEDCILNISREDYNLTSPYKICKTNVYVTHSERTKMKKRKDKKSKTKKTVEPSKEIVVEPFVKVELDVKKEEIIEIKSETDENELPDIFTENDNITYECNINESSVNESITKDPPLEDKKIQRLRRKRQKTKDVKPKPRRARKTVRVLAEDFGMKEELLSQEQQTAVMRERQSAEGYASSRFHCTSCYKAFNEEKAFNNHKLQHDPVSGELICDICKIRYKTRNKLCKHISTHHMKKYSCRLCTTVFYNRSSALKHYAWHKGVVYTCHICGATFDKKTSHQNHLRIKHPSEHVCGACGDPFVSKMGLLQHINKMHSIKRDTGVGGDNEGGGPFCSGCEVQFSTKQAWTRHVLISPKHQHERHLCALGCETCGESLADAESLRAHRTTHRRARGADTASPITCEQCGEPMASSRAYHAHFRRAHPDKTRTHYPAMRAPCMCELCGKVFQDKVHLKLHSYTHTGERPFKCDVCSKRFTTPDVLRIHVRSHTKELPYKCDICGQGFSNGANMKRHRVVHTDAKPYACETCGKCFKYRTTVKSHVEFVHMKKPWPKRDRSKRQDGGRRSEQDLLGFIAHA